MSSTVDTSLIVVQLVQNVKTWLCCVRERKEKATLFFFLCAWAYTEWGYRQILQFSNLEMFSPFTSSCWDLPETYSFGDRDPEQNSTFLSLVLSCRLTDFQGLNHSNKTPTPLSPTKKKLTFEILSERVKVGAVFPCHCYLYSSSARCPVNLQRKFPPW